MRTGSDISWFAERNDEIGDLGVHDNRNCNFEVNLNRRVSSLLNLFIVHLKLLFIIRMIDSEFADSFNVK